MKVARILHVLGVLIAIVLLSAPVMVLAGNDTGKPLSDVELQSFNGMGSWTLTQQNSNSGTGTNNNQISGVFGLGLTGQPFTKQDSTNQQTINQTTTQPITKVFIFQKTPNINIHYP